MKASRVCQLVFGLMLLGGGGYLIWHFLGRPDADDVKDAWDNWDISDFTDVWDNLTEDAFNDLWDEDPFVGDNSTHQWKTDGNGGLDLVMLKAFDDEWSVEFSNAISDWENGTPDTLTLTIQQGEIDRECEPVDGLMKVCNANYGDKGWLGINEMIIINDIEIQSSVAKMNEFYLKNADMDKRQYTMCHEIGHGFGLPHTDEQFDNKDLGNCLDYTNNPDVNLHPDETNFNRLKELYGEVGGPGRLRALQQRKSSYSPGFMLKYESAMAELEQARMNTHDEDKSGWRRLAEHSQGALYSRRLDETYTLKVHMLYDFN